MSAAHAAIAAKKLAVITGGASGIGLATATALYKQGMNVAIGDVSNELDEAVEKIKASVNNSSSASNRIWAGSVDVSEVKSVEAFQSKVQETFPEIQLTVLMANAGISGPTKASNWSGWQRVLNINLFGVINTVQTFLPMIKSHQHPSLIINTGSKQGITTPPASGPAYNVSKAGVKIFTEQLAHELREEPSTAHIEPKLLIPGYVFTNLSGMVRDGKPKPDGAWTVEQTVDYMMQQLQKGSFYILCPDNTTPRELDLKRMQWNIDDIIKDRPALSRWEKNHADEFEQYSKS